MIVILVLVILAILVTFPFWGAALLMAPGYIAALSEVDEGEEPDVEGEEPEVVVTPDGRTEVVFPVGDDVVVTADGEAVHAFDVDEEDDEPRTVVVP